MSTTQQSMALYEKEEGGVRFHMWARKVTCPMDQIEKHVPAEGRILDVGCGHGLFSNMLAIGSKRRKILGVDPMDTKIAVAQRVSTSLSNVRYRVGTVESVSDGPYDVITILDVLYLLPPETKLAVLRKCRELLKPDGLLVLKTNDLAPRWKYWWARFEEKIMTGLGLTKGEGLYFFSAAQNLAVLKEAGFEAETFPLEIWLPYPHRLFLGRPAKKPVHASGNASACMTA